MRHQKEGKKFHRLSGDRRHFLRNLASDLIRTGKIKTTESRAKALRPLVEKMITLAKKQDLASRRFLISRLHNQRTSKKLFEQIAPRYSERRGGYLKITKTALTRKRDGSRWAIIEFV